MIRCHFFLFCIGAALVCGCVAAEAIAADFPAVNVFRKGADGYNGFRIPTLIRAANGDLLAFCEARQGGDASETDLVVKRSTDQGASWGALQVVQESDDFRDLFDADPPPITIGNPCPVVDALDPQHAGRIWLPFTVENERIFVIHSDDHGRTWAPRREITSDVKRDGWGWYATGPVHSIQLAHGPYRGRLVVPADHRLGSDGQDKGPEGAQALISDDHGAHWRLGAVDDTYDDTMKANETTVVQLNDGRLYFNTRDQNGEAPGTRGDAYSSDGGESFDASGDPQFKVFAPSPAALDPPVVQCCVLRAASTRDGDPLDLILFSGPDENGPSGKGRSDLRIRYSTDEAQSWHDGPLIHTGPAAYSDMVRLADGDAGGDTMHRVGIVFEAGDRGGTPYDRIDFAPFSIADLPIGK